LETDHPSVTFTDAHGTDRRLEADAVVGCDGSFGPSRGAVPDAVRRTWERTYPYSWLGILADVAPSTDELIYAWHPDGFALHSMRSPSVSRLSLHVDPGEPIGARSDDRLRAALATRSAAEAWALGTAAIARKSPLPVRGCAGCAPRRRPPASSPRTTPGSRSTPEPRTRSPSRSWITIHVLTHLPP